MGLRFWRAPYLFLMALPRNFNREMVLNPSDLFRVLGDEKFLGFARTDKD